MNGRICHRCTHSKVEGKTNSRGNRTFWFYCLKNDTDGDRPSALEKQYTSITGLDCPYFKRSER